MDSGTGTGFEGTPPAASPSDGAHGSTGSTGAPAADGTETPPASTTPAALSLSMRRLAIADAAASSSSGGNGNGDGDGDDDDSAAASVEILSKVASFLSPGKTLHDVCMLAADRSDAAFIRQEYLENNLKYLTYVCWAIRNLQESFRSHSNYENHPDQIKAALLALKAGMQAWMRCNQWWKDASRSAFSSDQSSGVVEPPSLYETIEIEQQDRVSTEPAPSGRHMLMAVNSRCGLWGASGRREDWWKREYTHFIDVNGTRGESRDEDRELVQRARQHGDKVTLRLMHGSFANIFFDISLAVDLGLADVLNFQVDELRLAFDHSQLTDGVFCCAGVPFRRQCMPPLFHAFFQPDESIFDFLFLREGAIPSYDFLYELATILSGSWINGWNFDMHRVERFYRAIESKEMDVHLSYRWYTQPACSHHGYTPLDYTCRCFVETNGLGAHLIDLARLYLSCGAKLTMNALNEIKNLKRNVYHDKQNRKTLLMAGNLGAAQRQTKQMLDLLKQYKYGPPFRNFVRTEEDEEELLSVEDEPPAVPDAAVPVENPPAIASNDEEANVDAKKPSDTVPKKPSGAIAAMKPSGTVASNDEEANVDTKKPSGANVDTKKPSGTVASNDENANVDADQEEGSIVGPPANRTRAARALKDKSAAKPAATKTRRARRKG